MPAAWLRRCLGSCLVVEAASLQGLSVFSEGAFSFRIFHGKPPCNLHRTQTEPRSVIAVCQALMGPLL